MLMVLEKARALDRRRQAQISNQTATINRLLIALNDGKEFAPTVQAEMEMLTKAMSESEAQRDEAREVLRSLADACALTLPGAAISNEIDAALAAATQLIGPMTVSAPVSESGASAG